MTLTLTFLLIFLAQCVIIYTLWRRNDELLNRLLVKAGYAPIAGSKSSQDVLEELMPTSKAVSMQKPLSPRLAARMETIKRWEPEPEEETA